MGNRDPYDLKRVRKVLNAIPSCSRSHREKSDLLHSITNIQECGAWASRTVDGKCPGLLTSFLTHFPPPQATYTSS